MGLGTVCVDDSSCNLDSAPKSFGSKVKDGPVAMPASFIKYLLNTYYAPGSVEFPLNWGELLIT